MALVRQHKLLCPWQASQIEDVKRALLEELDGILISDGDTARLNHILLQIARTQEDTHPDSQLKRVIYVIAALSHHARWGGLQSKQVNQLIQVGEALLRTHGVDQCTSTLSFLWGELHLSYSQILRQEGHGWQSAWQQHYANFLSRRSPVGDEGYRSLASASRAFRLGHTAIAIKMFESAEQHELSPRSQEMARVSRIKAHRISGQFEACSALISQTLETEKFTDYALLEIEWETLCVEAHLSGDLSNLVAATLRNKPHRRATYLIEAFLWTQSVSSKKWVGRIPHLKNIKRICKEEISRSDSMKTFYQCALQLEQCYDNVRPLSSRLENLGSALAQASRLPSIDHELLFMAASLRWLTRAKQNNFAGLLHAEYQSKSRSVSDGNSSDVLNFFDSINLDTLYSGGS